jgi:hypothetical protein
MKRAIWAAMALAASTPISGESAPGHAPDAAAKAAEPAGLSTLRDVFLKGTIGLGGQGIIAIVQDAKTGRVWTYREKDSFDGGTVVKITRSELLIAKDGGFFRLGSGGPSAAGPEGGEALPAAESPAQPLAEAASPAGAAAPVPPAAAPDADPSPVEIAMLGEGRRGITRGALSALVGNSGVLFRDAEIRCDAQGGIAFGEVGPGSVLKQLGLGKGDRLRSINGKPVKGQGSLAEGLAALAGKGEVALEVESGGSTVAFTYSLTDFAPRAE